MRLDDIGLGQVRFGEFAEYASSISQVCFKYASLILQHDTSQVKIGED